MWAKKTEREILDFEFKEKEDFQKNRFKKSFKYAIWMFVGSFLFNLISYILFGVPNGRFSQQPFKRINWADLPYYLDSIIETSAILSLIILIFTFLWGKKLKSSTLMCDKCHTVISYSNEKKCECGGMYDSISNYKWIKDE